MQPMRGPLFETYVYQNLAGILASRLPRYELGFWSVQGRHELDFVVWRGRDVVAIEVKAKRRFHEKELGGLRAFMNKTPGIRAAVLAYNGIETVKLETGCTRYRSPHSFRERRVTPGAYVTICCGPSDATRRRFSTDIAHIYGLEDSSDTTALVLELVDGTTLSVGAPRVRPRSTRLS